MKLDIDYLYQRHEYWKNLIGENGIWDSEKFKPLTIQIRRKSKNYNAIFSRKTLKSRSGNIHEDRIIIYKNSEYFDKKFLDSVLVHEMIHQYIHQADIKDTSVHGKVFRAYMDKINKTFSGELEIRIRDKNPSLQEKGQGLIIHNIIITWTKKDCYFCLIHPSKLREFDRLVKGFKRNGVVEGYTWAQTLDVFFDHQSRCVKKLHGVRKPIEERSSFCKEYNIIEIGEKWLTLQQR